METERKPSAELLSTIETNELPESSPVVETIAAIVDELIDEVADKEDASPEETAEDANTYEIDVEEPVTEPVPAEEPVTEAALEDVIDTDVSDVVETEERVVPVDEETTDTALPSTPDAEPQDVEEAVSSEDAEESAAPVDHDAIDDGEPSPAPSPTVSDAVDVTDIPDDPVPECLPGSTEAPLPEHDVCGSPGDIEADVPYYLSDVGLDGDGDDQADGEGGVARTPSLGSSTASSTRASLLMDGPATRTMSVAATMGSEAKSDIFTAPETESPESTIQDLSDSRSEVSELTRSCPHNVRLMPSTGEDRRRNMALRHALMEAKLEARDTSIAEMREELEEARDTIDRLEAMMAPPEMDQAPLLSPPKLEAAGDSVGFSETFEDSPADIAAIRALERQHENLLDEHDRVTAEIHTARLTQGTLKETVQDLKAELRAAEKTLRNSGKAVARRLKDQELEFKAVLAELRRAHSDELRCLQRSQKSVVSSMKHELTKVAHEARAGLLTRKGSPTHAATRGVLSSPRFYTERKKSIGVVPPQRPARTPRTGLHPITESEPRHVSSVSPGPGRLGAGASGSLATIDDEGTTEFYTLGALQTLEPSPEPVDSQLM